MSRRAAWAALALALVAVPVTTWWLVGDMSEAGGSDYMFRAPGFLERHERRVGAFATVVLIASALLVGTAVARRTLERRDVRAALPLACLGIFLGVAYRVMTAAVGGANIGGGLLFMFGLVFVPAMLVLAFVQFKRGSKRDA